MELRITSDEQAQAQFGEDIILPDLAALYGSGLIDYVCFKPENPTVLLDGNYTVLDLEALVYWMRTYGDSTE